MILPLFNLFFLMYAQIFLVTSVRAIDFPPQIAASSALSDFGAKIPRPFFFMAMAFLLLAAFLAVLPAAFFSAVIFFSTAFGVFGFVVFTTVVLTVVFLAVVVVLTVICAEKNRCEPLS